MKKGQRLRAGVLCIAMAGLIALGGCGTEEPVEIEELVLPKNDGEPAKLTIAIEVKETEALSSKSGTFSLVLEEIIAKYQADFPDTEIEITEDVRGETIAAGGEGAPDIELFTGYDMYSDDRYPRDTGWLMDLSIYEDAWNEEGTVSNPASRIMRFMGGEKIYAVPCTYDQIMLYYRWDWFHEYNLKYVNNDSKKASVNVWGQFLKVEDKLGDKGRLAISEDVKPYLFDAMLWSWVGHKNIADLSAGYYLPDSSTIFSLEAAANAVKAYQEVLDMDMGADDPIRAFIDGEAGMYLGTGMDMVELESAMSGTAGEDWYAVGLPSGNNGKVAPLLGWTAWGVNKDTPEPEKAVHFLWYLTNADNNTHMYMELKDYGVKPIYREVEAYEPSLLEGGWYGEVELLNTPSYRYASAPLMFGGQTGVRNQVFSTLLEGLERGDVTPEEMLEQLDEEYSRLLNDYVSEGNGLPWVREDTEGK